MPQLDVRFQRNTALNEIRRRLMQLGILGSDLVFVTDPKNQLAVGARVNVSDENEMRYLRAIRMIVQVESVSKA